MTQLFIGMSKGEAEQVRLWLDHASVVAGCSAEPDEDQFLKSLGAAVSANSSGDDILAVGAAFGEALAERAGLKWVMVFDEYGLDFGLQKPMTSLVCFPLSMIQKRVEQGEKPDLIHLVAETAKLIDSTEAGPEPNADFEPCVFGLNSVDIIAQHPDGSIVLFMVTLGQMVNDPRTTRILAHKLATYEYLANDEYSDRTVRIKLTAPESPDDGITAWLDQQGARLRDSSIELVVEVSENE